MSNKTEATPLSKSELTELAKEKFKELKHNKMHWFSFCKGFLEAYDAFVVGESVKEVKKGVTPKLKLKRYRVETIGGETLLVDAISASNAKEKMIRQGVSFKSIKSEK
jgi:hypothetical protein